MSPHSISVILPIAFVLVVPVTWFMILMVNSYAGGWHALASIYRFDGTPSGRLWPMQSVQIRFPFGGYNHSINIWADAHGICLSPFFLIRSFHPPLFIPWNDVQVEKSSFLSIPMVKFRLSKTELTFSLREELAKEVVTQARREWLHASIA